MISNRILISFIVLAFLCSGFYVNGQAERNDYLDSIRAQLQVHWPKNRTIKLVFHGHSVPAGYFKSGNVKSLDSYPYLSLKKLNEIYPYAVISPMVTAIGGEQSEQGAERFQRDVLKMHPDVIFIDYSLNDRSIGLESAEKSWKFMIESALANDIKVILLTPTPDLREDISDPETPLAKHARQVRNLAEQYQIGIVDSYAIFQQLSEKENLSNYMSQNNHLNGLGHDLVANNIIKYFLEE
ncbi:SGNH/GDSL hydrolase family protein [Portibacter marinus]|uniref:SGNH/GDSL hydrolase family protein n=1 Tax=Portibacter marinus TaxID=2898660 RepID=UPI001F1F1969|nr:SGNH/GDSL hydrolase family protein [Portibacter marinus]